jgi:predicted transcriptional regulator
VLLTSRGRGVAVVQNLEDYEKDQEERAFMKAVAQGLMDMKNGRLMELAEVKAKLGIG